MAPETLFQYFDVLLRGLDYGLCARQGADTIVAASRPLSRMDASPRPLADELRYGLWSVVLWLASSLRILAGKFVLNRCRADGDGLDLTGLG